MTDGFTYSKNAFKPRRDHAKEWRRMQNTKDLREVTRKYLGLAPKERLSNTIGSKEGPVANVMRDRQGSTAIVSLVKRKGGHISISARVLQACFDRQVPLIVYLEGISNNIEWRFYEFNPQTILEDSESHTEDGRAWFRLQLGTAWRTE